MNKLFSITAAAFVAIVSNTLSATLSVLPGTSIQAKIDQAQPGDIVAIFGGTYNEDINIDKAIRLVEVSGQHVNITGNITFSGITNAPIFEGFRVGSPGRGIRVTGTTGLVLRNITAADFLTIEGSSSVDVISSQVSGFMSVYGGSANLSQTATWRVGHYGGNLAMLKCTVSDYIDTGTGANRTVVFRTTVAGDALMRSQKVWFGYCDARSFNYYDASGGTVVLVGCKIDRQNHGAYGVYVTAINSTFLIANNHLVRMGGDAFVDDGSNNSGTIANNYISMWHHTAIRIARSTKFRVFSNLIGSSYNGLVAPFGTVAQNNLYYESHWGGAYEAGGVVAEGTLRADPKFVPDQAPTLAADSPCINGGIEDPIYANRDGSRNTIGPSGGTLYDPEARTTENPVVISFDLGPEQVLEGEATEILLSNGQAVSQP